MVHTPSSSRREAATVAGPPAVTAPLKRSCQRPLRPPLRRWSPALCPESQEPFRSGSRRADPVSRRHGSSSPGLPPPRSTSTAAVSCQPGHRAMSFGVPLSAFLHTGLVNLFIQSGPSTACPGTGTGHGTASAACPPTLHQRALNSKLHEPRESPHRGWVAAVVQLAFHAPAPALSSGFI
jgi:hypothetical protein